MGQDPSGCAERSSGRCVCRHLVAGARRPAWRSGIAGERTGHCVVPEVACTGRGQRRPSEPSHPTWHLTGVCAASWSLVRGGPVCSDLHIPPVRGTPQVAMQPLLSHGAGSTRAWGHPLLSSQVPTVPPCGSSTCPSVPMPQSHWGSGAPHGWQPPCMGTWRAEVTWQGSLQDGVRGGTTEKEQGPGLGA